MTKNGDSKDSKYIKVRINRLELLKKINKITIQNLLKFNRSFMTLLLSVKRATLI